MLLLLLFVISFLIEGDEVDNPTAAGLSVVTSQEIGNPPFPNSIEYKSSIPKVIFFSNPKRLL
jgi:hypothetical protein